MKIITPNKATLKTPIGWVIVTVVADTITEVSFSDYEISVSEPVGILKIAIDQLDDFFKGKSNEFDLPLNPEGTAFQKEVWMELLKIPYGRTCSYLDIARQLGNEKVIRAAANANGKNPIGIIIPCHRVIGSDGSLTGYAGGLYRKEWLLSHEKGVYAPTLFSE